MKQKLAFLFVFALPGLGLCDSLWVEGRVGAAMLALACAWLQIATGLAGCAMLAEGHFRRGLAVALIYALCWLVPLVWALAPAYRRARAKLRARLLATTDKISGPR